MDHLWLVINFILENWEAVVALVVAILGYLSKRVSASRAQALQAVAEVIEELDVKDVKEAIAFKSERLHPAAVEALQDAVATVDPKKPTPKLGLSIVRELARLVGKR